VFEPAEQSRVKGFSVNHDPSDCKPAGRVRLLAAATLIGVLHLTGCATATFQHGVYTKNQTTYRVGLLGPDWQPVHVSDNDLAFHRTHMGTISANATCSDYEDVPTTALLNHLLFETTERRSLVEEVVTLDGRGARHVVMQAELDGVPLEFEVFVLKKDGCVFDLTHIRSPQPPPAARASFLAFVQQFAVLRVQR